MQHEHQQYTSVSVLKVSVAAAFLPSLDCRHKTLQARISAQMMLLYYPEQPVDFVGHIHIGAFDAIEGNVNRLGALFSHETQSNHAISPTTVVFQVFALQTPPLV